MIWLQERKMIAIKHPYDDNKEIDMFYFDNHLIVAQQFNFRFTQLSVEEVSTTLTQFQNPDEAQQPLFEREFSGIIHNERIFSIQHNPLRNELLFICVAENFQISYFRLIVNKALEKRQISLLKYEADEKQLKNRKSKLDKKQLKLLELLADVQQVHLIVKGTLPYLLFLRKNQVLEVVESFIQTVYVEQRLNLMKILPSFGDKVTFQFSDNSIAQVPSLDKLAERATFISEADYYKTQTLPPVGTSLYEIHNNIHFYQDSLVVNQSLFLLRDNIVFIVDTFTKQVIQKFYQKQKVVSLHKLRTQSDDEKGYKVTSFKIVAVNKNGSMQVFTKQHIHDTQNNEWIKTEINQTAILQNREQVHHVIQNQTSINCLYIVSQSQQSDQLKVYQMLYNTQIIELNLKVRRGDFFGSVNSLSRQREILAIVDSKYLIVYRNDKGNLIKLYQMNHTRFEFRDQITPQTVFYFTKDYILVLTKTTVFKVNLASSQIEQCKLSQQVKTGGSCFIDASCFYFLTDGDKSGHSKLAVADTTMIEASYLDVSKDEAKTAVVDRNQKGINRLMYPTWDFENSIKKLDYDEFNCVVSLQLSNFEIVQFPLVHRNTLHFMGMAERSFYLVTKKQGEMFYALDKNNYLSCWSLVNGQLLSRTYITSADYKFYETDKDLYDKNWFSFSLIYRPNQVSPNSVSEGIQHRTYKIIDIDERGNIFEWLTFVHPVQMNMDSHLYFNTDFNLMIELLINKSKGNEATYNLYQLESVLSQKWKFVQCLSSPENPQPLLEWHQKTLFPFTLNMKNMQTLSDPYCQKYETYKFIDKERVKILNTQDGIEIIYNTTSQSVESYMALQYSFANTKESFYDKKCGHFYIQEVTSRLQNFFEQIRRNIYLKNKTNFKLKQLDVSARDYKYKFVIEQSYTLLDHQFFKQYIQDKPRGVLKTFKQMSVEHVQRILHNIFPEGKNTLLHVIAESDMGFESVDFFTQLAKKEGFVVPFLLNADEMTPLDLTVNRRDFKQSNSMVKMLSKTPMDHHSRLISHLIPKLIDMNLPALEKYFDRRKFQTGACKTITLGRINIRRDQEALIIPSTLMNDNEQSVKQGLMNPKCKEQSMTIEVLDVPLYQFKGQDIGQKQQVQMDANDYEIKIVKSLANCENQDIFGQKSVRSFLDFMWPCARRLILHNLFLPYLAFILYYMVYLIVLKKLTVTYETDPTFFDFTAGMFTLYDALFKVILFMGCFYFFYQDFLQIKNFTNNPIVLWSYANIFPLSLIIFIIVYDLFVDSNNTTLEKTFYSASSFFIWIRVIHLLKCFPQTSYLLRMGAEILHRMRYLIAFIGISLLAFGFTFYFVSDQQQSQVDGLKTETPFQGFGYMFHVLIGQYDAESFNNAYLNILLVVVSFFNVFFIFTLIVALSVVSFSKDSDIHSNEAYQDKASLIALYSYLMTEQAVREASKKYLLIATVTEGKKSKSKGGQSFSGFGQDSSGMRVAQAKMLKNMDRRLNNLTTKVEKTLKDISDRLDSVSQQQRND